MKNLILKNKAKIVGVIVGFAVGGFVGALLGFAVGVIYDARQAEGSSRDVTTVIQEDDGSKTTIVTF